MDFTQSILQLNVSGHVSDEVRLRRTVLLSEFISPPEFKVGYNGGKNIIRHLAETYGLFNVSQSQLRIDIYGVRAAYAYLCGGQEKEPWEAYVEDDSTDPRLWLIKILRKNGIGTLAELEVFSANHNGANGRRTLGLFKPQTEVEEIVESDATPLADGHEHSLCSLKEDPYECLLSELDSRLQELDVLMETGRIAGSIRYLLQRVNEQVVAGRAQKQAAPKLKERQRSFSTDQKVLEGLVTDLQRRCADLEERNAKLTSKLATFDVGSLKARDWDTYSLSLPSKSPWFATMGEDVNISYSDSFREEAMELLTPEQRADVQKSLIRFAVEGFSHRDLCSAQVEYGSNGFKGSYWASLACSGYSFLWYRDRKTLRIEKLERSRSLKPRLQQERANVRLLGIQKLVADLRGDKQ